MKVANTTYIVSHVPLSSIPISWNVIPSPHSHGPSGRNVAMIHVRTATTRIVVSQSQVPLVVSGCHIPTFGTSYGLSQGIPHIPTYGVSHGTYYGASHG